MAIEITSKSGITRTSSWILIGIVLCVVLAIIVGAFYLYFTLTINKMNKEIEEKDKASAILTENILKKEAEILPLKTKISDFSVLINKHETPYNVFEIIEKNCLPEVWFFKFSFDIEKQKVSLLGKTESFELLEQQLTVFKKESSLKKVILTSLSTGEEGEIEFALDLIFDSEVFKLSLQ